MDNRNNKDFDELEPRITPLPTVLQRMTGPTVPEVSLIFGSHSGAAQFPAKTREAPEPELETYASWKKDGLAYTAKPKLDSRRLDPVLANRPSANENFALKNTATYDPSKFRGIGSSANYIEKQLENEVQTPPKRNKNTELHNYSSPGVARSNTLDNTRVQNYTFPSRDEIRGVPFPKNKPVEKAPTENGGYAIKSILKNAMLDRSDQITSKPDQSVNPEMYAQRRNLSGSVQCQSPRRMEDPEYQRASSSVARYNHQKEADHDRDTVRELLLLVQNQNEQIKSLQSQVERLLQTHEQSLGCHENHICASRKPSEKLQSPNKMSRNNVIATQNSCQSRGIQIVSPHPADEHPDLCLRYQGDQLRNTIMEKKVSIGVMTSFEFSVQNNPFVTDSDNQINAVLRECGKNINEPGENWRANMHCPRNIVPATLENINEDSESHPSSIWKLSNNNTQVSDKTSSEAAERKSNTGSSSPMLFRKSPCPPVAAPRSFLNSNDKRTRAPQSLTRPEKNANSPRAETLPNRREHESFDPYRAGDGNNYERVTESQSSGEYPYLDRNDRRNSRESEQSDANSKSIQPSCNAEENSMVLNSSDLKVTDKYPPSPDPSIHVEMREYSSDDENERSRIVPPVGWTFYKNVVGQVNRILQTIPDNKDLEEKEVSSPPAFQKEVDGREEIADSVKNATLERLKMLGISFAEQSEYNSEHVQKKVTFDSSYYPRVDYQATIPQAASTIAESNTSMHMKALALKYLSDEQLADLAVQRQGNGSAVKHKVLNSMHATNMSMATMNYLQRYCLVSGGNTPNPEAKAHLGAIRQKKLKHVVMTKELLTQSVSRHEAFNNSANSGAPDNILDITTLKQQPKLL